MIEKKIPRESQNANANSGLHQYLKVLHFQNHSCDFGVISRQNNGFPALT